MASGCGAFGPDGGGGCSFGVDSTIIPAAGSLLGANYNPGHYAIIVGTALGAVGGAIVASHFGPHVVVFGAGVFILGLLCAVARSERGAYRFGVVTLWRKYLTGRNPNPVWEDKAGFERRPSC